MEAKGETTRTRKAPKLPLYLVGAHAETVADMLGCSLAQAKAMKAAHAVAMGRVQHTLDCVRGTGDSENGGY